MTYRELLELLKTMETINAKGLDDTVTIYDASQDVFIAVNHTGISGEENDVLDEGHLFLDY